MKTDVAIIGAGFAGLSLAHSIVNSGLKVKVTIAEQQEKYPSNFRSDKIEFEQAGMMRRLGILQYRQPAAGPIGDILVCDGEKEWVVDTKEQYGIDYTATINNLREQLPDTVQVVNAIVTDVRDHDEGKLVSLAGGKQLQAKLVVVCTGGNNQLIEEIDIRKYRSDTLRSLTFGFDIKKKDGSEFYFKGQNGLAFHNNESLDGVYYIIIFPIGDRMRCNLFSQIDPKSDAAKNVRRSMIEALPRYFPGIYDITGEVELSSSVKMMATRLYRLKNYNKGGLLILGDEFQSVNPASGTGFSKILSDVDLLTRKYIPKWFAKNDFSKAAVSTFYSDKDKLYADVNSMQKWLYYHKKATHRNDIITKVKQRILSRGYFFMLEHF